MRSKPPCKIPSRPRLNSILGGYPLGQPPSAADVRNRTRRGFVRAYRREGNSTESSIINPYGARGKWGFGGMKLGRKSELALTSVNGQLRFNKICLVHGIPTSTSNARCSTLNNSAGGWNCRPVIRGGSCTVPRRVVTAASFGSFQLREVQKITPATFSV